MRSSINGRGIPPRLDVNNTITARDVNGGVPGGTTGLRASASTPFTMSDGAGITPAEAAAGTTPTMANLSPIVWLAVLIGLFVALGFVAKRAGEGGSFANLQLSLYNVFYIALASIIGGAILKVVFSRFYIRGLSDVILAS
jgi:hypothetical protein